MMVTKSTARQIRKGLCIVAFVPVLLLSACADKVPAPDPAHQAEIAQALEIAQREKSARQLSEARLGNVLWLAMLGGGAALMLGLAIGRSSRQQSSSISPDPAASTVHRVGCSEPRGESTA